MVVLSFEILLPRIFGNLETFLVVITGGKELPVLVTSRIGNIYRSMLSKILRVMPGQEPQGRVSSVSTRSACLMLK